MRPLGDNILVLPDEKEPLSAGGIVLPENSRKDSQLGTVIAASRGKMDARGIRTPLDVEAGDRVLFGKYGGTEVFIDGQKMLIMHSVEVLAVVV